MSDSKVEIDVMDFDWSSKQTPEMRGRVLTVKIPAEYKGYEILSFAIPMKSINKTKFITCNKCMTSNNTKSKFCFNCGNKIDKK